MAWAASSCLLERQCSHAWTAGSTAGSFRCGRQLEVVAGHRLDPSACKKAASTRCSVLAISATACEGGSKPAFAIARVSRADAVAWLPLSGRSIPGGAGEAAALVLATQVFVANGWLTVEAGRRSAPLECCIARGRSALAVPVCVAGGVPKQEPQSARSGRMKLPDLRDEGSPGCTCSQWRSDSRRRWRQLDRLLSGCAGERRYRPGRWLILVALLRGTPSHMAYLAWSRVRRPGSGRTRRTTRTVLPLVTALAEADFVHFSYVVDDVLTVTFSPAEVNSAKPEADRLLTLPTDPPAAGSERRWILRDPARVAPRVPTGTSRLSRRRSWTWSAPNLVWNRLAKGADGAEDQWRGCQLKPATPGSPLPSSSVLKESTSRARPPRTGTV